MIIKNRDEILTSLMNGLVSNTPLTNLDPGSIARAFSDVLSDMLYDFYTELDLSISMSFVSTAQGAFLDLIGELLDCKRLSLSETDDNYRARIVNQVYVVAGANLTALRLKILTIGGVKNVIMREFTRGTGSFTVYVITDTPVTPDSVLLQVQDAVDAAKAFGIYAEVKTPQLISLGVRVRLIFDNNTSDLEKASIRQTVRENVQAYVDTVPLGGSFVISRLQQYIMDADSRIKDMDLYEFRVDNIRVFVQNLELAWDERVVIDTLDIN